MGGGQWELAAVGTDEAHDSRGQGAQEIPETRTKLLGHFWCSKDLSLPQLLSRDDAHF